MRKDDASAGRSRPKLHLGMTFNEVCAVLGPPDGTNPGSEILGGKGPVVGFSTSPGGMAEFRSRLFFTSFCQWSRPEGNYELVFEHDRLARVTRAPEGAVDSQVESSERGLPARFVWLVADGDSENPRDVLNTLLREGVFAMHPDALVYAHVDSELAVDLPLERVMTRGIVAARKALDENGKERTFLDIDSCKARRFRKARGPGWAGVLVTITGPNNDPDSSRCVEIKNEAKRDVCGKCGITQEERLRQFSGPAPRGTAFIGSMRGAFMYCEECRRGICGRCSIDLGMTAGCPLCRSKLVYMDGGRQEWEDE